ncbi:MAG: ABC transporter permease [Chloroflexi bacterium]|nr:ABC transporter permease [Chloroflexota bacterium]
MELLWHGLVDAARLIARTDPELIRITSLSLAVSLAATALAALAGVPAGVALATGRFAGRTFVQTVTNTGMALPPVVVGLTVTVLLWRTGPLGALGLLYTPSAMVLAQFIVAAPIVAGLTRAGLGSLEADLTQALRVDGAGAVALGRELVRAALPQVLTAIAAGFGRAIAEVGASLMVGGNLLGQTRILTTAITLETSKGEFARAMALGIILLALAFAVNAVLTWLERAATVRNGR